MTFDIEFLASKENARVVSQNTTILSEQRIVLVAFETSFGTNVTEIEYRQGKMTIKNTDRQSFSKKNYRKFFIEMNHINYTWWSYKNFYLYNFMKLSFWKVEKETNRLVNCTNHFIPQIDHRHFWPIFNSLTLNFNEVMQFQVLSSAAADCYASKIIVKNYSGYEIRAIL